ncbi:hypothetical protein JCM19000A_39890 [Silvimonas sp. JCM 19000]
MKTRDKTLVPRNPFAVAASQRKAGAHEKTEKTKRRDARQALKREMAQADFKKGGLKTKTGAFFENAPVLVFGLHA